MMPGLQNTATVNSMQTSVIGNYKMWCTTSEFTETISEYFYWNLCQRSVQGIMMLLQGVARITAYGFAFAPTFRRPAHTRQGQNMTDKVAMQRLRIKHPIISIT